MRLNDINEDLGAIDEAFIISPRTIISAIAMYKELKLQDPNTGLPVTKAANTHGISPKRFMNMLVKRGLESSSPNTTGVAVETEEVPEAKKRRPKVKADGTGKKSTERNFVAKHDSAVNRGGSHSDKKNDYKRKSKHPDNVEEDTESDMQTRAAGDEEQAYSDFSSGQEMSEQVPTARLMPSRGPNDTPIISLQIPVPNGGYKDIGFWTYKYDPTKDPFNWNAQKNMSIDQLKSIYGDFDMPVEEAEIDGTKSGKYATMKTKPGGYLKGQKFVG